MAPFTAKTRLARSTPHSNARDDLRRIRAAADYLLRDSASWRPLERAAPTDLEERPIPLLPIVNTLYRITFVHWGEDSLEATMNRKTGCGHATSWLEFTCIPLVAFAPLALADSALEGEQQCAAVTAEQARSLADELLDQGVYQRAGECYQAAGEYELANRAFLNAVEPESKATARQVSDQRDQARTLLRQVQQAFRSRH
ncbi:MAG TPA: hypothetical protein VKB20_05470 [Steroidobacteraceae bacterium]|nr:hypothetical protein [Steroidobacteraceae bacterium]